MRDIQNKFKNNRVATDGFIRGEIGNDECMVVDYSYYVMTIPKGVILKGFVGYLTDAVADTETGKVEITVGDNTCILCDPFEMELKADGTATCTTDCECKIVDQDYVLKVKMVEVPDTANIFLMAHVINPEDIICSVTPVKLCTETFQLAFCSEPSECSGKGCKEC